MHEHREHLRLLFGSGLIEAVDLGEDELIQSFPRRHRAAPRLGVEALVDVEQLRGDVGELDEGLQRVADAVSLLAHAFTEEAAHG